MDGPCVGSTSAPHLGITQEASAKVVDKGATITVTNLGSEPYEAELGVFYKLKVKAKRGGAKLLTTTVSFQPC